MGTLLWMGDGLDDRIDRARRDLQALLDAGAHNHPAWKPAVQRKANRLGELRRQRDRLPSRPRSSS